MKLFLKLFITALLLTSAIIARATTVSLDSVMQELLVDEQLILDVLYDFGDEDTVGGAFSVSFDKDAFDFVSFQFDADFPDDKDFRVFPTSNDSGAFDLGFANFSGLEGSGKVGILTFQANQDGSFDFTLGNPVGNDDPLQLRAVSFSNAQVTVKPSVNPVPLPGAAWLLVSGFAGLGLIRQRKHSN